MDFPIHNLLRVGDAFAMDFDEDKWVSRPLIYASNLSTSSYVGTIPRGFTTDTYEDDLYRRRDMSNKNMVYRMKRRCTDVGLSLGDFNVIDDFCKHYVHCTPRELLYESHPCTWSCISWNRIEYVLRLHNRKAITSEQRTIHALQYYMYSNINCIDFDQIDEKYRFPFLNERCKIIRDHCVCNKKSICIIDYHVSNCANHILLIDHAQYRHVSEIERMIYSSDRRVIILTMTSKSHYVLSPAQYFHKHAHVLHDIGKLDKVQSKKNKKIKSDRFYITITTLKNVIRLQNMRNTPTYEDNNGRKWCDGDVIIYKNQFIRTLTIEKSETKNKAYIMHNGKEVRIPHKSEFCCNTDDFQWLNVMTVNTLVCSITTIKGHIPNIQCKIVECNSGDVDIITQLITRCEVIGTIDSKMPSCDYTEDIEHTSNDSNIIHTLPQL
jgi:hypothetical protein